MLRRRIFSKVVAIEKPYASAVVGDIYCSDNTIVSASNYSGSGKTAVGIVIYNVSGDMRVMALTTVTQMYGGFGDYLGINETTEAGAIKDLDGTYNSAIMRQWISGDTIADSCHTYTPSGSIIGDWYCPAIGEVYLIGQNFSTVNASRVAVGLSAIGAYTVFVSSTEYNFEKCWYGYYVAFFELYADLDKNLSYDTYPFRKITY